LGRGGCKKNNVLKNNAKDPLPNPPPQAGEGIFSKTWGNFYGFESELVWLFLAGFAAQHTGKFAFEPMMTCPRVRVKVKDRRPCPVPLIPIQGHSTKIH
jgi:hypothetical protein